MAFKLTRADGEILWIVAERRLMTTPQLAALLSRNGKSLKKRISELVTQGLLADAPRGPGQRRGRPERLVSLAQRGVGVLQERELIDPQVPTKEVLGERLPPQSHQLLLNWVRVHLHHVGTVVPELTVRFLAHNAPFLPPGFSNLSILTGAVSNQARPQRSPRIEPDAAFSISDTTQDRTVLFFLEVDRGTETAASPRRKPTDIRQKILNYGICFDTCAYKKYEELWDCRLNGFRLLFVTDSTARLSQLCALVQAMPPSDYIWLTTAKRMFEDGIGAEIWVRGGRLNDAADLAVCGAALEDETRGNLEWGCEERS